jgi:D-lactate dehydrogenase
VVRVPAYSPYAVAEHTVGLILTLNRKIHRAYARVREGNFSLDGLLGFDLHGRTVGVIGTGKIGAVVARIMKGFGCQLLAYDPFPNPDCERLGVQYVSLQSLFTASDIVTLHCPLTPETHHLIDAQALGQMKSGVMLINSGRGALIDTQAVIEALKSGQIGYLGLDVYEEEADLFFEDLSDKVIRDDVFARLLTFPNVVITGHQGFFTEEALKSIAETTLANITAFEQGQGAMHEVSAERVAQRAV